MNKYMPLALSTLLLAGCGPKMTPTQAEIQNAINATPTPEQIMSYTDEQLIDLCGGSLTYDSSGDTANIGVLALEDTREATENSSGIGVTCARQYTNLGEICPLDPSSSVGGVDSEKGEVSINGDCDGDGKVENTILKGDPYSTQTGQPVILVKQ